jgi:PAS domain-containing protein/HPt (histidine-containing phosphotransfer) domain-containing protein
MALRRQVSSQPLWVVAIVLPLVVALWTLPLFVLDRQQEAQRNRQFSQVIELAELTESLVAGRLAAVESLLLAAQQEAPLSTGHEQLNGLVRGILVLQPGEERSFVAGDAIPPAALPLLFGAPRLGGAGEWILPVLRPAQSAGEAPVAAALDPHRLLTVPAGAGAMLLAADGKVEAAAGSAAAALGQAGNASAPAAEGLLRHAVPLGATGMQVVALLPQPSGASRGLLVGIGAGGLTLIALAAGLLLRQQHRQRAAALLAAAAVDSRLRAALERAAAKERLLGEVLHGLDLGACLLDGDLRLLAWNDSFAGLAGVAPQALRRGQGITDLELATGAEPRAPGAIRTALPHRLGDARERRNGCAMRFRPDGSRVQDRWTWLEEGLLLTCRVVAEPAHETRPAPALADLCAEELRKRLPLLLAAASVGDVSQAHSEAHAMRGVAANFGLAALAESLSVLEAAARSHRMLDLRQGAQALPPKVDAALASLLSDAA